MSRFILSRSEVIQRNIRYSCINYGTQEIIAERTRKFESDIVESKSRNCDFLYYLLNLWSGCLAAKALQAAGQPGIIILPNVQNILDTIRGHSEADERYAICTSGEPIPVFAVSVVTLI